MCFRAQDCLIFTVKCFTRVGGGGAYTFIWASMMIISPFCYILSFLSTAEYIARNHISTNPIVERKNKEIFMFSQIRFRWYRCELGKPLIEWRVSLSSIYKVFQVLSLRISADGKTWIIRTHLNLENYYLSDQDF